MDVGPAASSGTSCARNFTATCRSATSTTRRSSIDIVWLVDAGHHDRLRQRTLLPDGERDTRRRWPASWRAPSACRAATTTTSATTTASIHEADINRIAEAGITSGCGASRFCPDSAVTRAQMASFLARALALPATTRRRLHRRRREHARSATSTALPAPASPRRLRARPLLPGRARSRREQMAAFLHRALGPVRPARGRSAHGAGGPIGLSHPPCRGSVRLARVPIRSVPEPDPRALLPSLASPAPPSPRSSWPSPRPGRRPAPSPPPADRTSSHGQRLPRRRGRRPGGGARAHRPDRRRAQQRAGGRRPDRPRLRLPDRRFAQLGICWEGSARSWLYNSSGGFAAFGTQWYNSPTHRNIMLGDYTHAGGSSRAGRRPPVRRHDLRQAVRHAPHRRPGGFTDIGGSPFSADIEWLVEQGITDGLRGDPFCPTPPVSREQMASFLKRAIDLPGRRTTTSPTTGRAATSPTSTASREAGVTTGCAAVRYCPRATCHPRPDGELPGARPRPAGGDRDYFWDDDGNMHEDAINRLAAGGHHQRLRRRSLLPGSERDPRADGRLPPPRFADDPRAVRAGCRVESAAT